MVFASGGIRTPRTILRENGISIHKFSTMTHLGHRTVEKLLDGDDSGVSDEQKGKFQGGLTGLFRSDEQQEEEQKEAV